MSIKKEIDFFHPYALHHVCGLSEETSIAVIGKLKSSEMSFLEKIDFDFGSIGWPSIIEEKDLFLNEHFPINLEEAVKEDSFVLFGNFEGVDDINRLYDILNSRFSELKRKSLEAAAFSSYFAHIHNDKSLSYSRGQFNLIIDNPKGHALISQSTDGKFHKIIPKKGDIIFLDIHCDHALLPNQDEGFDVMRENPMVVAFFS